MLKLIVHLKGTTTKQSGVPGRQGATSESFLMDSLAWGLAGSPQYTLARALLEKRAALLPTNCSIYGLIYVQLDGAGVQAAIPSYSADVNIAGTANLLMDIPQAAVQFKLAAQNKPNRNIRKFAFMPDARIVTGEYANADNYSQKLNAFMLELSTNWGFKGLDSDADVCAVNSISGTGIVSFAGAVPGSFDNGVKVRFMDARASNGVNVTGTYTLRKTNDGGFVYRLLEWGPPKGITGTIDLVKGELMNNAYVFCNYFWPGIDSAQPKACVKKIGRPLDLYHGRRSTKR